MKLPKHTLAATSVAVLTTISSHAANGELLRDMLKDPLALGFIVAIIFVVAALVALNKALNTLRYITILKTQGKEAAEKTVGRGVIEKMTEPKSAEEEADLLMDHEYDGIHELDNDLPPWWKWGFYISIAYAVIYCVFYFGTGDLVSGPEEYKEEMAEAQANVDAYLERMGGLVDESNVTLLTDNAELAKGKDIYMNNCAACHLADGGGSVGPNLTDQYWLHGGDIVDVFSTIKYGVPAKGMIAWEDQLGPKAIQQVASYIMSLQGTTPANPKEPQGELYAPTNKEEPATEASSETQSESTQEGESAEANS